MGPSLSLRGLRDDDLDRLLMGIREEVVNSSLLGPSLSLLGLRDNDLDRRLMDIREEVVNSSLLDPSLSLLGLRDDDLDRLLAVNSSLLDPSWFRLGFRDDDLDRLLVEEHDVVNSSLLGPSLSKEISCDSGERKSCRCEEEFLKAFLGDGDVLFGVEGFLEALEVNDLRGVPAYRSLQVEGRLGSLCILSR